MTTATYVQPNPWQMPTTYGQFSPQLPQAAGAMPIPTMPTSADLNWAGGQNLGAPQGDFGSFAPDLSGNLGTYTSPGGQGGGIGRWLSNGQNLGAAAQAFGALSSAWLGYQNLRTAKDQLNFQKGAFEKNFRNQTQSYNTQLEDRIRGRSANPNEADIQAYLARHSLSGG